jgi:hypothetical protein
MNTTTKYETPVGTFGTWEDAAQAVERADMDPCECIKIVRNDPPNAGPSLASYELGPGGVVRLSFQVKVF